MNKLSLSAYLVILFLVMLLSCQVSNPNSITTTTVFVGTEYDETIDVVNPGSSLPVDWWKKAVFYECYVRGFQDSSSDGIGDLKGLIQRLDYLKSLGIGGIWLMPVTESSDNDHGYAVTDYRDIEDDYGSIQDLNDLLTAAHSRGIGVIMDLVINHTSSEHPFFVNSSSAKHSNYRNWYCWSDEALSWTSPWGSSSWHKISTSYFYAIFWDGMPDLNYKNKSVQNYMADNIKFWLNKGLDGFRFDAVPYLIENGADAIYHQSETLTYYHYLRTIFDQYTNIFTVCEDTLDPEYYIHQSQDAFQSSFAFDYNTHFMTAIKNNNASQLYYGYTLHKATQYFVTAKNNNTRFSIIQANHDYFAGTRPFTQFSKDINKCKLAASFQMTVPGIPFVYYGEEIAISENSTYSGDWSIRTPMQWTSGTNAGFTTGTPFRSINSNHTTYNVEDLSTDSNSILNHYKKLITIRNNTPSLYSDTYQPVTTDNSTDFLSFVRYDQSDDVVVILNFSTATKNVTLDFTDTHLENLNKTAGNDLYDNSITYSNLTTGNYTAYSVSNIPAYGIRIIPFSD